MNVIAESESAPDGDGMTVQLAGDPYLDGMVLDVRLIPEDLVRVRAYVEQGQDVQGIEFIEPDLWERIWAAVLGAVAPADGWGVADDILFRDLLAAAGGGGGR